MNAQNDKANCSINVNSDVIENQAGEDFAYCSVPEEAREKWTSLTYAWFGAAMFVGLYYAGVEIGTSMGNINRSLLAILVGALFLGTFVSLNGIIGYKTGCNAALSGIYSFGSKGVAIPGFHIADIGWYIMMTAQFAAIIHTVFPQVDIRVYCILISLLFVTNGLVGFKQMANLNRIAMPILLFVGLFGVYKVGAVSGGLGALWDKEFRNTMSMATAITAVVGTWVSGSSRAADYFRFARKPADVVKAAFIGFFGGFIICIGCGVFWGAGTDSTDIGMTLATLGIVFLGLLMFFLQTWTTNEHSAYVTSTALPVAYEVVAGGKKVSRRKIIALVATLSMVFAGLRVENYYIPFISFLGIFIPVIGAITIADFYIMSKTKYHWTGHSDYYSLNVNSEDVKHHTFNWATVPSLILGFLISTQSSFGIPSFNCLIGTIIVYCISSYILSVLGLQKKETEKNMKLQA